MSVVRNALPPLRVIKRYVSSKSYKQQSSQSPAKMRALVSLYHETEHFVTPENLSQKIDEAFFPSDRVIAVSGDSAKRHVYETVEDLQNKVGDRRRVPRIGEYNDEDFHIPALQGEGWSSAEHERVKAVAEALYGTVKRSKPGLEVLEESVDEVQQALMEDRRDS